MALSCTVSFVSATYWLKIDYFSYTPLTFSAVAPYVPFGISRRSYIAMRKLESSVMGLSSSEDRMIVDTVPACDRQTDRQTDGRIYYS